MSNKTERFSYKGRYGMYEGTHIEAIKRRAGLGYIDKQLWVISDIMLFKTVIPLRN